MLEDDVNSAGQMLLRGHPYRWESSFRLLPVQYAGDGDGDVNDLGYTPLTPFLYFNPKPLATQSATADDVPPIPGLLHVESV